MQGVTYQSDVQDMYMISDETYDIIISSHVLEHVENDRKALKEMKRILKEDGMILFLVPIDLNANKINEEWGLSEEENWRRFGQGDYCRRYDKWGLIARLKEEYCVYGLGKDYFGEEEFRNCGLTETSMLYILAKKEMPELGKRAHKF